MVMMYTFVVRILPGELLLTNQVYEQSRLTRESGAAVHLAPNANGILRRWGIYAESFGADPMAHLVEYMRDGHVRKSLDLRMPNKRWQHPWHLVHRAALITS